MNIADTETVHMGRSYLRPVTHFEIFWDRFTFSPIIGSGIAVINHYPFNYLNYHNDYFITMATSGLLGGIALLMIIKNIYKKIGPIFIMPFILPALSNSFLKAYIAVILYSFVLGMLWTISDSKPRKSS
jgi:O-antigen ligase